MSGNDNTCHRGTDPKEKMNMVALQSYHYPHVYRQLLGYVKKHEMQVLLDEGLYRHVRFKTPGTSIGYFDLITWPGALAINGDIGEGLMFIREPDMFSWFHAAEGNINPAYWSEKLSRGCRDAEAFSADKFGMWLRRSATRGLDVEALVAESRHVSSVEEAVEMLAVHHIEWDFESPELWRDYRHHFLLACHAILWGVRRYLAAKQTAENQLVALDR